MPPIIKFQIKDLVHRSGPLATDDLFMIQTAAGYTFNTSHADVLCGLALLYSTLVHAPRHENGGADPLLLEALGTAETDTAKVFRPDGAGGATWGTVGLPTLHASSHARVGSDPVNVESLRTAETNLTKVLKPGPGNSVVWGTGGGGGASAFTDLTDVPSVYTGQGGLVVAVKGTEDGLEFIAGGGGGYQPTKFLWVESGATPVIGKVYATIQAAINYAETGLATDVWLIKIAPGIYTEDIYHDGQKGTIILEGPWGSRGLLPAGGVSELSYARLVGSLVVSDRASEAALLVRDLIIDATGKEVKAMSAGYLYLMRCWIRGCAVNNDGTSGSLLVLDDCYVDGDTLHAVYLNGFGPSTGAIIIRNSTLRNDGSNPLFRNGADHSVYLMDNIYQTVNANIIDDCTGVAPSYYLMSYAEAKVNALNEGSMTGGGVFRQFMYLGTKEVDESAIGDGKVPVYRTSSGKLEYETVGGAATYIPYHTLFIDPSASILCGVVYNTYAQAHAYAFGLWTDVEFFFSRGTHSIGGDVTISGLGNVVIRGMGRGQTVISDGGFQFSTGSTSIFVSDITINGKVLLAASSQYCVVHNCAINAGSNYGCTTSSSGSMYVYDSTVASTTWAGYADGTSSLYFYNCHLDGPAFVDTNAKLTIVGGTQATSPFAVSGPGTLELWGVSGTFTATNITRKPLWLGTKEVDESGIADGYVPVYRTAPGTLQYESLIQSPTVTDPDVSKGSTVFHLAKNQAKLTGKAGVSAVSIASGGLNYAVGNILTILQANSNNDAQVVVSSIGLCGVITGLCSTIYASGNNYSTASGESTSGGAGSGATVDITAALTASYVVSEAVPTLANGSYDGQRLLLRGTSDTNHVTLQDESNLTGSKLNLAGAADVQLKAGDTLDLVWDNTLSKWCEVSRSINRV